MRETRGAALKARTEGFTDLMQASAINLQVRSKLSAAPWTRMGKPVTSSVSGLFGHRCHVRRSRPRDVGSARHCP